MGECEAVSVRERMLPGSLLSTLVVLTRTLTLTLTLPGGRMEELPPQYSCPELHVDFNGNNVDDIHNIANWNDCGTMCEMSSGCNFWTWIETRKQCYLKSSDHGLEYQDNAISGVKGCK